jgi:hypothetical protein
MNLKIFMRSSRDRADVAQKYEVMARCSLDEYFALNAFLAEKTHTNFTWQA